MKGKGKVHNAKNEKKMVLNHKKFIVWWTVRLININKSKKMLLSKFHGPS